MRALPQRVEPATGTPRVLLLALLPIGDTLLTTPTIRAMRQRYPSARITALVRATNAPVMRCTRAVDDVVVLPSAASWRGSCHLARVVAELRAQRFDVAVNFTSPAYKWISLLCGIPRRTYMKFDRLWWAYPGDHRRWRTTHASRHYYDAARELDLAGWREVDHAPRLDLPPDARAAARSFLRRHSIGGDGRPIVAMHPGGAWLGGLKQWPLERFADLADRLSERWQARILILGSHDETCLASAMAAAMRHRPIVATGSMPLLTSLAVIEACDLFIGNDSGLLHAAAAVGSTYLGIYGPTCVDNFHPLMVRPNQGTLVVAPRRCRSARYFVGGSPIWDRPCCAGTCRSLGSIDVCAVLAEADKLLAPAELTGDPIIKKDPILGTRIAAIARSK